MTNLRMDTAGTKKVRNAMQRMQRIKIDRLSALRDTAERTSVPNQRLLNKIQKRTDPENRNEDRLARIEKEIARIKKKLAA